MGDQLNHLKKLYEDGYRCIYHDSNNDEVYTVYLKNFDEEKSQIVELEDSNEYDQFKSYIDDLGMQ